MIKVHATGKYQIIARKTGKVLFDQLPVDFVYEVKDPFFAETPPDSIVRKVMAEVDLRILLVADFHKRLRDRATYLKVGGTQWCIELGAINFEYQNSDN